MDKNENIKLEHEYTIHVAIFVERLRSDKSAAKKTELSDMIFA